MGDASSHTICIRTFSAETVFALGSLFGVDAAVV